MIKKILLSFVLLAVIALIAAANVAVGQLKTPLALESNEMTYQVKSGASLRSILKDFEQRAWLESPRLHEMWLRYAKKTAIQRGEYRLKQGMTSEQVVDLFLSGQQILRSIQFIEGKTFKDYLAVIKQNEYIDQTLDDEPLDRILDKIDPELDYHEGWFFPDTYLFEQGTTDVDILKIAYKRMKLVLEQAWAERADSAVVKTPYEALILASIIEKETGAAFERAMISGVFTRRINLGMKLQTDPTVIYGMGDAYDGNIRRRDLRTDTPYNTYTRFGLPPTPIANPGQDAIEAALNPDDTGAVFFVAKGDGTHQFSETLVQHNEAVRQYQRFRRAENYQSAPPTENQ